MQTVTRTRTRTMGRTGSLRSARKALWLAIHRGKAVLVEADDPGVILQACTALTLSIHEYAALMRAIEHPDA